MPIEKRLFKKVIKLLKCLIRVPSFSKEEQNTADLLIKFFEKESIKVERKGNNILAKSKYWDANQSTILLNSHHDTVRPAVGWSRDPFNPEVEGDKLYGLGSNDAGGSLVALIATFLFFYNKKLPFNLLFVASAEEEISGANGIASIVPFLKNVSVGIIGEPTSMQMAIAEKGLMVIDANAKGKAGHAARSEGENALYKAMKDIEWIRNFKDENKSNLLGPTKMTVTQISAGHQHNVVPDECDFVIDCRTNEHYSNQALFEFLKSNLQAELTPRSFRLNSSYIPLNHPLIEAGLGLGMTTYGSPTLSDQALLPFPCLKLGCGDSARSHTPNEFIYLSEIENGIHKYILLIQNFLSYVF